MVTLQYHLPIFISHNNYLHNIYILSVSVSVSISVYLYSLLLEMDLPDIAKKLGLSESKQVVRKAAELRRMSDLQFDSSSAGIVITLLLFNRPIMYS